MKPVIMVAVTVLALPVLAAAQETKPNAALQYWQAFSLMPTNEKHQAKQIEQWNTIALDGETEKFLTSSRASLMFLNRGAKMERCDWGLDLNDGVHLYLPHIAKARELSRIAALHARRELAEGRPDSAVQNFVDVMTMARHISSDFTLISKLVRYNIESTAMESLAPSLPKLKAPHLAKIAAAIDAPLGGSKMSDVVRGEKTYLAEWLIRKLKEADEATKGSWREFLLKTLDFPEGQEFAKNARNLESVLKMLDEMRPFYDELARLVELPQAEFDKHYPPYSKKLRDENAGFRLLMPAMEKAMAAQSRNQVQRALFRAAVAIVQEGPNKVAETKDLFGDGPFGYRAFAGGFELNSKFRYKNEPVSLKVGVEK